MLDRSELVEEEQVKQILYWIGFTDDDKREAIREDALINYQDLGCIPEKEINTLRDSFQNKMSSDGKMTFGSRRTRYLKAASHWARDFARISKEPTIIGLNKSKMLEALNVGLDREKVRQNLMSNSDIVQRLGISMFCMCRSTLLRATGGFHTTPHQDSS